MTLQTMRKTLRTLFQSENIESPETDSGLILMHILQINKNQLLLTNPQISEMHQQEIMNLAYRRIQGEPVRYLIGSCPFMDLTFDVNPSVLIPRPDTELLVEAVSKQLSRYPKNSMLWDIGCGSGCIGISLAHMHPSLHVTELDISQKALDTATATACRYHLENRIRFVHHDILSGWPSLPAPAVIVSNPPYIPSSSISNLQKEVRDFEPQTALDGGPDGLLFYRKIISDAPLLSGGLLAFEIGYDQGSSVPELMKNGDYTDVTLLYDLSHLPRMVLGYHK
ncbi:peptide chain release factor N(5)-glutamine methyltransferase [Ructibacterium gallinarum]|uniref:Release factor glutamine methyltransferase n=1 Tax=Ructibacterium gallinarum TaxID=2779355 RepID=A0A9D5R7Z3_9FIRM|nr:peptide chain release factor N(5)-glutamine methyltransferase [Ructibacterium gallinarum]MBE5039417.1 peptide chain release factor N(5)-glutamine methyltransferase [Ructibacterium gallinarum]